MGNLGSPDMGGLGGSYRSPQFESLIFQHLEVPFIHMVDHFLQFFRIIRFEIGAMSLSCINMRKSEMLQIIFLLERLKIMF